MRRLFDLRGVHVELHAPPTFSEVTLGLAGHNTFRWLMISSFSLLSAHNLFFKSKSILLNLLSLLKHL